MIIAPSVEPVPKPIPKLSIFINPVNFLELSAIARFLLLFFVDKDDSDTDGDGGSSVLDSRMEERVLETSLRKTKAEETP